MIGKAYSRTLGKTHQVKTAAGLRYKYDIPTKPYEWSHNLSVEIPALKEATIR